MSLGRFRRSPRLLAALLLLAAARVPHFSADDPACVPAAIPAIGDHDETRHALQPDTPDDRDHCAVCHWIRSLRSPRTPLAIAGTEVSPPNAVHRPSENEAHSAVVEHLPARAPPSQLT